MNQCEETIALVQTIGKALLGRLSCVELNVRKKDNNHQNLVTDFDIWVQDQLKMGLANIEPKAKFFAEEQENARVEGLTWFIDPIDGTTNFITMQRNFANCVALYNGTKPIFGVVYDVVSDICYHAIAGEDAYRNGKRLPKRTTKAIEDAMVDMSLTTINNLSHHAQKPLYEISRAIRGHRAIGAASLAMCHIAEGALDVYVSYRLYPWDYAASGIILEAVGGVYESVYGEPLYTTEKSTLLCCGDKALAKNIGAYFRGECDLSQLNKNISN